MPKAYFITKNQTGDRNQTPYPKSMETAKIKNIRAREILDSRGNPTIEVEVESQAGVFSDSVPSGASQGKHEALELRDGGSRYQGKGVMKAVHNVNNIIAPKLIGKNSQKQKEIDGLLIKLDGTPNKSKLGANAILGVSMAVCRAGAAAKKLPLYRYISQLFFSAGNDNFSAGPEKLPLPLPCFNVINGGAHAANEMDFQEFMIVPQEKDFKDSLLAGAEIYQQLKKNIKEKYIDLAANLGDEGGFAPPITAPEEALDLILEAAKISGHQSQLKIILDIAASQFFSGGRYKMRLGQFDREELADYYLDLISKYPIKGLEDPFGEDDWEGWEILKSKVNPSAGSGLTLSRAEWVNPSINSGQPLSKAEGLPRAKSRGKSQKAKALIIGDDLLTTNSDRIREAKKKGACDAAVIKINQIGTLSEAIEAAKLAKSFKWKIMVANRAGETNDDFISDFAVGIKADLIKAGAPARGERLAKYNRLLKIEQEL